MNATGQNKEIEMTHERRYNAAGVKGCSGVLDSIVYDCGCRKPSHRSWYKETGQIMTGKWHVGQEHGVTPWNRGFDRSLSHQYGAVYFDDYMQVSPFQPDRNAPIFLDNQPLASDDSALPQQWYSTDLWTDYSLKFLDEARAKQNPFFLYLAYCAPHFPLSDRPVCRCCDRPSVIRSPG
jgi:hypothetical protein